jgi:hypothetical protein
MPPDLVNPVSEQKADMVPRNHFRLIVKRPIYHRNVVIPGPSLADAPLPILVSSMPLVKAEPTPINIGPLAKAEPADAMLDVVAQPAATGAALPTPAILWPDVSMRPQWQQRLSEVRHLCARRPSKL